MPTTSKIALVTGGSRGLGKNMAVSLAKKGINVLLTYHRKQDEAQTVVAEIEALGQQAVALPLDTANAQSKVVKMMAGIGIGQRIRFGRDRLSVVVGVLVLFFRPFFVANLEISEA